MHLAVWVAGGGVNFASLPFMFLNVIAQTDDSACSVWLIGVADKPWTDSGYVASSQQANMHASKGSSVGQMMSCPGRLCGAQLQARMLTYAVLCCAVHFCAVQPSSLLQLFLRPDAIGSGRQQCYQQQQQSHGGDDGQLPSWAEEGAGDGEGEDGYYDDGDGGYAGAEGYNAGNCKKAGRGGGGGGERAAGGCTAGNDCCYVGQRRGQEMVRGGGSIL